MNQRASHTILRKRQMARGGGYLDDIGNWISTTYDKAKKIAKEYKPFGKLKKYVPGITNFNPTVYGVPIPVGYAVNRLAEEGYGKHPPRRKKAKK